MGEGTLSQGALWSHTAYEKYLHAFTTPGPGTQAPTGHLGEARPSAPQMVTPEPSLGLSVDLYSVGFYLQTPRLGGTSQEKARTAQGAATALRGALALLSEA